MPDRKALAAAALMCLLPVATVSFAQSERVLTEAPAQTEPVSVAFDRADAKYAVDEEVGLFIQATEDAYVTILNVSPGGSVVKLFPNKYQTESLVPAGKRIQVPDPASGARLQVSGPVGQEQIKVFYSKRPLTFFADLGGSGDGMFRSVDGGMDEVSRSLDQARSLGAKVGSRTLSLTTVERLPAPAVAAVPEEKAPAPEKPVAGTAPDQQKPKPKTVVAKPTQGQGSAQGGLAGKKPETKTVAAPSPKPAKPAQQKQVQQAQSPQLQMPQLQMPQIQMPQIQLPGGVQLQLPQLQIPIGRSAEGPDASVSTAEAAGDAAPACVRMLDKLNASISAKDVASAAADADAIAVSAECGQFQIAAQRRVAALHLSAAQEMMAAGEPLADYEAMLVAADGPKVLWQAAATLGEARFAERRFAEAAADFQQAIEIIKNETRTPKAPSANTIGDLIQRAAQARILAANPSGENPQGTFVPVGKDHRSGMLGGIYSQDVRGIKPVSVPVPITFEFNQSTFTSIGSEAAQELLEAIKEQKPDRIVLIGHTDRRGSDDYNQKLSIRRAQAVADFLKSNGIEASIEADGHGASEPVDVAATGNLTEEDIDALNRRVEWRRQ